MDFNYQHWEHTANGIKLLSAPVKFSTETVSAPTAGDLDILTWMSSADETGYQTRSNELSLGESVNGPSLVAVVAADGTITMTITPASGEESTDIKSLIWRVGGPVSVSTESRTGAGDLVLNGLTNDLIYGVAAVHVVGDVIGKPSVIFYAKPTDGTFAPTGAMSKPLDVLADMLSNTSAWQDMTSTANAVAAKAKIHLEAFNGSTADVSNADYTAQVVAARPFAIISQGEDYNRTSISMSQGLPSGQAILEIEAGVPSAYQGGNAYSEAKVWFMNYLGAIVSDLFALSDVNTNLHIGSIELLGGPERTTIEQARGEGDALWVALGVSWGYGGGN